MGCEDEKVSEKKGSNKETKIISSAFSHAKVLHCFREARKFFFHTGKYCCTCVKLIPDNGLYCQSSKVLVYEKRTIEKAHAITPPEFRACSTSGSASLQQSEIV